MSTDTHVTVRAGWRADVIFALRAPPVNERVNGLFVAWVLLSCRPVMACAGKGFMRTLCSPRLMRDERKSCVLSSGQMTIQMEISCATL